MAAYRTFFSGSQFRKLLGNAGVILGGNGVAGIMNLLAMALAARALGPEGFGTMVLITAYVLLIDGVANLNSWQALIRFGTGAIGERDERHRQLAAWIKLSVGVDALSRTLGFAVCAATLALFGDRIASGLDVSVVYAFSAVILFHIASGTASGLLRLYDDFRTLSLQAPLVSFVTLAGFGGLAWSGAGIASYVYVQALASLAGAVYVAIGAARVLRREGIALRIGEGFGAVGNRIRPFLRFLFITNATSTVSLIAKRGDVLIVGFLLGEVAVGLYRVATMFASIPGMLQGPFHMAVYPQLASLLADRKPGEFRRLARQSAALPGLLFSFYWFGYLVLGALAIELVFGTEYSEAWRVGLIYLLGTVISGFALPLTPVALAHGQPESNLRAHVLANLAYLLVLVPLLPVVGLVAAGIAYLVYYAVWSSMMLLYTREMTGGAPA